MKQCINCEYYNPQISRCGNDCVQFKARRPDDWCAEHKPKQETNTMKDKIQVQHSVLLNGTWYVVEPKFEADDGIYFYNPVPQPAPAAPAPRSYKAPEVRSVYMEFVKTSSPSYKREEFVFACINEQTGEITQYLENEVDWSEMMPVQGQRFVKMVFQ